MSMSVKTCSKCGDEKSLNDFAQRAQGRRHAHCKSCQGVLSKQHYDANREAYRERAKMVQRELRAWVSDLKKAPCADCDQRFNPWQMDFDHRDGSTKRAAVSVLIGRLAGVEVIQAEIAKCDLVCANCHRNRTHYRASSSDNFGE